MRIFFTLILCMVLVFTDINSFFDSNYQKAAGVAVITVVGGGVLYLIKSTADARQQLAEQKAKLKIREEVLQNFKNADAQAAQAFCKIKAKFQTEPSEAQESSTSPEGAVEQNDLTLQDLVSLIRYGQALERLQMLAYEIESELSKTGADLK